jgi:hypothetical protein
MAVTGIPVADERLIIARARRTETPEDRAANSALLGFAQRIGYAMQGDNAKAKSRTSER